ncbi:MAG: sodium/solute symporter [Rikenellaceae bacterium]|jgi:SSS family solute:Na+ symporter|nr:sodium/solute symporter [Rikenellaceae bacterium]
MNAGFTLIDYVIFAVYCVLIVGLGLWLSRTKKGEEKTSSDYFLAGRTLAWWAIGASLIAANISAEHFIGMSGSGFRLGMSIAAYEWMAAPVLILVAFFVLPVMLEKKVFTMPQMLRDRYSHGVSLAFSILWLFLYIFVNLTSVAWLGSLAMVQILGDPGIMLFGMAIDAKIFYVILLMLFAGIYSITGGLKSVALTDVIQVVFLIGGGLITAYFALAHVGAGDAWNGLQTVFGAVRETPQDMHLNMVIPEGSTVVDAATGESFDIFKDVPGLALIFGAIWLTNIGYWGFNQYIIQKGLAAKNLKEAKKGLVFAAYLKILIPIIVVVPGITAYVLFNHPTLADTTGLSGTIDIADDAYPWLLRNFAPVGVKGIAFAALVAAIVSSLASMLNSTSTIFTMDIYKNFINKKASEKQLVGMGRLVAFASLIIATIAAKPLLGGLDQAFQYIQEYSGYIYPGVVVVFGMAIFWKRATNKAALWAAIATLPVGVAVKLLLPDMGFQLRMGYVFMILVLIAVTISLLDKKRLAPNNVESPENKRKLVQVSYGFFAGAALCFILGLIYSAPLAQYAFQAIFMLGVLLAFVGLMLIMNGKAKFKDANAYEYDLDLFRMDKGLIVGAIGVVVILLVLYAYFW